MNNTQENIVEEFNTSSLEERLKFIWILLDRAVDLGETQGTIQFPASIKDLEKLNLAMSMLKQMASNDGKLV